MQLPTDTPDLPPPAISSPNLLLLAVGGGAAAVLPRILADWPSPPDAAVIDTDEISAQACPIAHTYVIGHNTTRSHSAAGDPSIGLMAAKSDTDRIRALLAGHDVVVILACLGGGTASGAAPYVAKIARDAGLLVIAFVTTPFDFEGQRRADCATDAIAHLRAAADTVIRLPNQSLHALLPPDTPLVAAFAFVNRMLTAAIRGLWTLLARENILNIDISDLQYLVENSANECRFAYAESSGPARADNAIRILLDGPMLDHGRQLANAGAILLSIVGDSTLTLAELSAIQRAVRDHARPNAHILVGAAILENWSGQLSITLLASDNLPAAYARPLRPMRAPSPAAIPAPTIQHSAFSIQHSTPQPSTVSSRSRGGRRSKVPDGQGTLFIPPESSDKTPSAPAEPPPDEPQDGFPPTSVLDTPTFQRMGIPIPQ